VFLAREVYEKHGEILTQNNTQILDLCAGCGIVGMDLAFHLLKEKSFKGEIDFLEVQEIYQSHFEKNKTTLENNFAGQKVNLNWIQKNYAEINNFKKYDLIVSNPPYFVVGQGKLSPNEFKNRCRFFVDSDWQTMVQFIKASLMPEGVAYFLVREDLKQVIAEQFSEIKFPFQVRSAWVAQVTA
jgi:tRNA1(Val) A37 N6-methylase TrmN6